MADEAKTQPRRQFCLGASRGLLLAALGPALAPILQGCNSASPTGATGSSNGVPPLPVVNATDVNGGVAITIDASSPLATVGAAALAESQSAAVLVVRNGASDFSAFSAICTHRACTITGLSGGNFVCPCHGSEFSASGQVLSGPALASLQKYNAQFSGNVLTITG
jgi:Rieske Fe-S protein